VAALLEQGAVDQAATAALEGLGPSVLGYLGSLHEEDDARDVFSAFAEDLWRGLPGFRRECSLRAWAFRLAWHASARFRRDPFRRRGERLPPSAASRLAASIAGASQLPGGRRDALRQLREALDPEERTLLVLRIDGSWSGRSGRGAVGRRRAGGGGHPAQALRADQGPAGAPGPRAGAAGVSAPADRPAPGALSALLAEIARVPDLEAGAASLKPGDAVGRFQLLREVGRGGFGQVFEAQDPTLRRRVALKVLKPGPSLEADPARAALLSREARRRPAATPDIVTVHDVGRGRPAPSW
jgi:RNA polymerase sigma-70 factor (ECF subfamily)